jgi:hypothetical protein
VTSDASERAAGVEHWLGPGGVPWNILLDVRLDDVPDLGTLRSRLARLATRSGWPVPATDAVVVGEGDPLLGRLGDRSDGQPVSVGRAEGRLVVCARHAYVDGLGLLAVTRDLLESDLASRARGVQDRPRRPVGASVVARLAEVALRPPAPLAGTSSDVGLDAFTRATVARPVRTAALVHAAVRAVTAHNRSAGAPDRRIAVAVGVSTTGGAELKVGDHSGFLRLTDAERLSGVAIVDALRTAPLQPGGTARTGTERRAGNAIRWASRACAGRLGSTLLVSHLGRVDGSLLRDVAFYPFSGTGSGVSLGGATVDGCTVLTLRARGATHRVADLESLLGRVVSALG